MLPCAIVPDLAAMTPDSLDLLKQMEKKLLWLAS